MVQKRAADVLVDCLVNQGVKRIFGVPGESYLSVLDALVDQPAIKFITTRHEGGASYMAEAAGKLTGQPGICFVTRGPGATNASIGVHTAMQNSSPMILFIGQIGRAMTDREAFQEVDYRAFFGPIAKWVTQIDDPDRMAELVGRAFAVAQSGRPGPVVVALPEDMLREVSNVPAGKAVSTASPRAGASDAVEICKLLKGAKRPLIIAGGGGWTDQGRKDLQSFAQSSEIPVVCGFRNQDLMETSSPVYIGDAGFGKSDDLKQAIGDADVILAINIRFGEVVTDGWTLFDFPTPKQTIVHTHVSGDEIGKVYQCALGVVGTPNSVVAELSKLGVSGDWQDWANSNREVFLAGRKLPETVGKLNVAKICSHLNTVLNEDAIITNGAGNFAIWPGKYLNYGGQKRLLAPQSGAMGAGIPAAVAAKMIDRKRQVVCFAGDGDFQMTFNELGTAMEQGIDPIILIHNNGSYGTIRMHQEMRYPKRISATNLHNPDFGAIAAAYGLGFAKIHSDAEFPDVFEQATNSAFGFIIEMVTDPRDIAPHKVIDLT